ncbi:tRNA (cytosine(38)-C(5))-methyltransferase isoform X4 [Elephas maximus indicus]|uniref:tRNA (cytosine(38)-C(5))-methyltransferase isoform X4 n=1 Tax=Elephas maximus indicus TaxID=99487 RepID=UPI0021168C2A|nr:tRNA (cytosine(38)-C(5))-methyltransferase isoform X4 [Elephas maximus indicus]
MMSFSRNWSFLITRPKRKWSQLELLLPRLLAKRAAYLHKWWLPLMSTLLLMKCTSIIFLIHCYWPRQLKDMLIQTIENCGFQHQEFLLSPNSLGIPNSRLRYFLIAKLQSEPLPFQAPGQILLEFPKIGSENPQKHAIDAEKKTEEKKIEPNICLDGSTQCSGKETILFKLETAKEVDRKHQQNSDLSVQMLKDFLEHDIDINQYFLSPKLLQRYAFILDIVKPTCRRSTCFTKGYGRFIEGTGSVLQTAEDVQIESIYKSLSNLSEEEKITKLLMLKLRYFTPKEIANLLGFPPEFGFPENVTVKQRYCLLGNSLNVHIVAKLIKILF